MPTTVTKTIGNGTRNYTDLQTWINDCPNDLTSADEIWSGECYNDSGTSSEYYSASTNVLVVSGITTDATRYVNLTAAAGQSFQDNAGVRTNPLKFDGTKGVGLKVDTSFGADCLHNSSNYMHVSRLQFYCDTQGSPIAGNPAVMFLRDCYGENKQTARVFYFMSSGSTIINCVAVANNANTAEAAIVGFYGLTCIGCTVVRPSNQTPAGVGINASSGNQVESCAIFGFTTPINNNSGSTNNATDNSTCAGSSNQTSVTYNATTPFTQADAGSALDFRSIASTALAANGFLDSTNAPNDISKTARAGSPTIGAWELVAAAAGQVPYQTYYQAIVTQ